MNDPNQRSVAPESSRGRKLRRGPLAVTVAALLAMSALGLALGQDMHFAVAEPAQTVQTPYGVAPLSFADLVEKVSPAVVSINVKGDSKVADNDLQIPGMPDIPEDSPLYDFFKHFRQGQGQYGQRQGRSSAWASHHGAGLGLLHLAGRLSRHQQPRGRGRRRHLGDHGEWRQVPGHARRRGCSAPMWRCSRSRRRKSFPMSSSPRRTPASVIGCSRSAIRLGSAAR